SAGRGGPNSSSHACEENPITQDRFPSRSRKPTARSSAASSAQRERTASRPAAPGFSVTILKIAARGRGCTTAWGAAGTSSAAGVANGPDSTLVALPECAGNEAWKPACGNSSHESTQMLRCDKTVGERAVPSKLNACRDSILKAD